MSVLHYIERERLYFLYYYISHFNCIIIVSKLLLLLLLLNLMITASVLEILLQFEIKNVTEYK